MEYCEGSSRPTTAVTADNRALVENMIHNHRSIVVCELQHDFNLPHGTLVNIIHNLGFNKAYEGWVPQELTEDHKKQQMACVLLFLQGYSVSVQEFLKHIVTGDKT
jgi:hypothetical protein